jgi:hypothetical protein
VAETYDGVPGDGVAGPPTKVDLILRSRLVLDLVRSLTWLAKTEA